MSVSSARRRVAQALAAGLLGAATVGCSGGTAPDPAPAPSGTFAEIDPSAVDLARIEFCRLVPEATIAAALAGEDGRLRAWTPGDQVDGQPVLETGCEWTGPTMRARAWIFARPLAEQAARSVAATADRGPCRLVRGEEVGTISAVQRCRLGGDQQLTRYAGLFGETWLSCELRGPQQRVRELAEPWCAGLVEALDTTG